MNIMPKNDKLEFQIYDWLEDHEEEEDEDTINPGKYIIHIFGRCLDGKSVYGKIKNFTPYFYILLPNKFQTKTKLYNETLLMDLEAFLKSKENKKIFYKYKNSLIRLELHKFKKAEGFTNDKEYYFARLVFNNVDGLQKYNIFLIIMKLQSKIININLNYMRLIFYQCYDVFILKILMDVVGLKY